MKRSIFSVLSFLGLATGLAAFSPTLSPAFASPAPDPDARLSIGDATVFEGNSPLREVVFPVRLSKAVPFDISAKYLTKAISATAETDYRAVNLETITLRAGQTQGRIVIRIVGDTTEERDEQFAVELARPISVILGDNVGVCTIRDDDYRGRISVGDVQVPELNSSQKVVKVPITLSESPLHDVLVTFETKDDTAKSSFGDFVNQRGTFAFRPGRQVLAVEVPIIGDEIPEIDEKFFVAIKGPANSIAKRLGTVTIQNDDGDVPGPTPTPEPTATPSPANAVSIGDITVNEGDTATAPARFTVSLQRAEEFDTPIAFEARAGTALAPGDYTATSGTVTILAGETSATLSVPVVGDTTEEADEAFTVFLSAAGNNNGGDFGGGTDDPTGDVEATCTIRDDDYNGTITIADVTVDEGNFDTKNVPIEVTLNPAPRHEVRVNYSTEDLSATQPSDYARASGTLTFTPQVTKLSFDVVINGDLTVENDEIIFLKLTTADRTISNVNEENASLTIRNDDIATPANASGQIAFGTARDGNQEIYIMNGDGTNQTRLTNLVPLDNSPGLSPDAKKIAFVSNRSGADGLYTMNPDGTGVRLIYQPANAVLSSPRFSPDSKFLALLVGTPGSNRRSVVFMFADGTVPRTISERGSSGSQLGFAPNGLKIVYSTPNTTNGDPRISIMNPDGGEEVALTTGAFADNDPTFSPDGKKIAFVSTRGGLRQIYTMNPDGTEQTVVNATGFRGLYSPSYSPDGKKIAFGRLVGDKFQIGSMNVDGTDQRQITTAGGYNPSWSIGTVPSRRISGAAPAPEAPSAGDS